MLRSLLVVLSFSLACDAAVPPGRAVAQAEGRAGCRVVAFSALPAELFETSGLARGVRDTTLFWTHNDGSEPLLYALDARGAVKGTAPLALSGIADWEDIESAHCDGEPCLLVADIGDNDARRSNVAIHEIAEPAPGDTGRVLRSRLLRYPDGPRDAEALLALPEHGRFIVTKGRHGPISLYRIPESATADAVAVLELVQQLAPQPRHEDDRVTGATASPDGRWVAVRTYRTLRVYGATGLLSGGSPAAEFDLSGLREEQGEAVVIDGAGAVWLTSEAEDRSRLPGWVQLTCPFPESAAPPEADDP